MDHHSKKPHSEMSKEELMTKVGGLRDVSQQLESELRKLRRGVHTAIKCKGIRLNTIDNNELLNMLEKHQSEVEQSFPDENSLQRVLWEQQCKWTKLANKSSMQWHPMIIKWCLYMKNKVPRHMML